MALSENDAAAPFAVPSKDILVLHDDAVCPFKLVDASCLTFGLVLPRDDLPVQLGYSRLHALMTH